MADEEKKLTAIVVDDTDMMRMVIRAILEQLDFEVVGEAEDGREGVDLAIALEPDLILLDVMMPKMNGYLALEEIVGRMHEPFVVMLTGVADEEVVQQSMLAGAQGYIRKGNEADGLAARLASYKSALQTKRRA